MRVISGRGIWAGLLAAGVIVAAAIGVAGPASADQERAGSDGVRIKMKLNEQGPFFKAPDSIEKGARLTIVNRTDPKQIGPHTFTLVKKGPKPHERIIAAHEADTKTVNKRIVDSGKTGWDRAFTADRDGDSWYTDVKGETHGRKVRARSGKTIRYFCAIHPEMKGKFEVE